MNKILTTLFIGLFCAQTFAQTSPFQVVVEPISISGLTGAQSYAFGQVDGQWLIIGGRKDGLHRRQPFASFDAAGQNDSLIVIDPIQAKKWTAPLSVLPTSVQEQLRSTNMEFFQDGDYLYLIGGYGYSNTAADHITYPNITAVHVEDVINAVINKSSYTSFFRQITDQRFAITGGYLNKIYDTYYLTGGQRFDGRYNPMGGPTYTQTYSNSIIKFKIIDNGNNFSIDLIKTTTDATNLHRRDYNVVPQILPNGQEGLTAFSGVFQANLDLPYLNCVNIDSASYSIQSNFSQYYNHYHCAHVPLYSASKNKMHSVFFGGIAQYYDSAGTLVQDNNVPFVNTIARVTRTADGKMTEYKLPTEMPGYLGSSSEFILAEGVSSYPNDIIELDSLEDDTLLIGYIYGGIRSTAKNIFFINDGSQSSANAVLYSVKLIKDNSSALDRVNTQSSGGLHLQVYPNPNKGELVLYFSLLQIEDVQIKVYTIDGREVYRKTFEDLNSGRHTVPVQISTNKQAGIYFVEIKTKSETSVQKIIINP
jgi:hypothetical protein